MFSNRRQLQKRTPDNGTDREGFLSLLVDEYLNSGSYDAKCQVLANLANFAYDPVNYGFIRDVGVLDVFLHVLKNESNETLLKYATAGICNLCLDPLNAKYIQEQKGLEPLISLLKGNNTDTVLNVITTLIYLFQDQTISEEISTELVQTIKEIGKSDNKQLSNLTTIFLQDVCGSHLL